MVQHRLRRNQIQARAFCVLLQTRSGIENVPNEHDLLAQIANLTGSDRAAVESAAESRHCTEVLFISGFTPGGPAGFEVNSFVVLVAPKGLPATVRAKINADVAKAIAEPDVKARFDTFAFEPIAWSPEEIARNAQTKSKVYEQLVKRKNISLE